MGIGEVTRIFRREILHGLKKQEVKSLSTADNAVLMKLRKQGFCAIPQYKSAAECAALRSEIDRLITSPETKIWRSKSGADTRIFGADEISPPISAFYNDPYVSRILNTYEKSALKAGFTMASRITFREGNAGSGEGWHRDRADYKQTKAILYLSDVTESDGPTQYIEGSHGFLSVWLKGWRAGLAPLETRIEDEAAEAYLNQTKSQLREFTAQEGTLLLLDTRGIHRGKPLLPGGDRYALTNYYWYDSEIPEHINELTQPK